MKKSVVFILSCLLLIPGLANAWTLVVNNTNATSTQYVTITWANNPTGVKVAVNGPKSIIGITAGQDATATYTLPSGTVTPSLDGVAQPATGNGGTVAISAPSGAVRQLTTTFSAAATATYSLNVSQTSGGIVKLQVGGASTTMGYNAIQAGTSYSVTAIPNAGFRVYSTSLGGFYSTGYPAVGAPATVTGTASANTTVSALFVANPTITATDISLPASGVKDSAFTAAVMASVVPSGTSLSYAWQVANGGSHTGVGSNSSSLIYTPTAFGTYSVAVTISATGATPVRKVATINVAASNPNANYLCVGCHTNSTPSIISAFNANQHPNATAGAAVNGGACSTCHTGKAGDPAGSGPHANRGCVGCHAVPQNLGSNLFVKDNNGVRAVTLEFNKWSHHVTGVQLNDAHCAACHLEGKFDATANKIVVDNTKHLADNLVHLRNADTDADFQWNPESPNHGGMDTFCMSCHDANGATSAGSADIQAYINANYLAASGKTASATNPFGDTISNRYDKYERPAVVNVDDQFDTTNASHHAVKGAKYTGRTRAAGARQITSAATFAANSTNVLYGARTTIYDAGKFESTYRTLSPVAGDYTLGDDSVLHCGDCHTVGQFAARGTTAFTNMSTNFPGISNFYKEAIGAHGSANEYLLRNSIGTDQRHVGVTYSVDGINSITVTNPTAPYLVCFNCHAAGTYNSIGNVTGRAGTNHAGEYANQNRCNGPVNTISFAGYTTSIHDQEEPYSFRLGGGQPDYLNWPGAGSYNGSPWSQTSDSDFSNMFGIQCANCHNSGPNNMFGGIHGSRVNVYTDANGAQQKPYRFLPGLGNTMYVPGSYGPRKALYTTLQAAQSSVAGIGSVSDLNWEQADLGAVTLNSAKTKVTDNSGCYTLVPETDSGTTSASYSMSPTYKQKNSAGDTLFGEWGGCDDHRGNTHGKSFAVSSYPYDSTLPGFTQVVSTGGAGVARKVLRPVTY